MVDDAIPNKLYKKLGVPTVISAVVGATIVVYWYDDPEKYRTMGTKEFLKMMARDGYEQLN